MTIAVHISAGKHEDLTDNFNFNCFSELALARPECHFIFIFDSVPHPEIYLAPNCTPVILQPSVKNTLLAYYWYNYKLPAVIQKYNPEIFITDGPTCSFRLTIAQCLVINKEKSLAAERGLYLKRFMPAFLQKAAHVFTIDPGVFDKLNGHEDLPGKISLLYPGLSNELRPFTFEEREAVKDEYTGANEYFLHLSSAVTFENVKILLKAFSIFKKWQKSSMRMVIIVTPKLAEIVAKELTLYKYKEDVLVRTSGSFDQKLITCAYCLLLDKIDFFNVVLPAMSCGVPVIIKQQNEYKNLSGPVTTIWDEKNISEKLITFYKDEFMRSQAIHEGREYAARYSWKKTIESISTVFQKLVHA